MFIYATIGKYQTTNYAIVYFFIMSYKYILTFQSFTLAFIFHYNFVHLYGILFNYIV